MSSYVNHPALLQVDLDVLASNWQSLRDRFSGPQCGAVIKADGYGLGSREVFETLRQAGCQLFFVAQLNEALKVHDLLDGARIHVLNGLLPGEEHTFVETGIRPVLNSLDQIEQWQKTAHSLGRDLPAMIHLDTGMRRLGLPDNEVELLIAEADDRLNGIIVEGWMTHPACADDPDSRMTAEQLAQFKGWTDRLPKAPRGFCNSAALFNEQAEDLEFCRPGIALYGGNPCPGRANPMRQVIRLTAKILQIREIDADVSVGYGASWRSEGPARIATIGVGYADGYHRILSNITHVTLGGHSVPLAGRVSMDLITLDVTDIASDVAKVGAEVTLIGGDITPETLADAGQTIDYEVLTGLGRRYDRVYLKG